MRLHIVVVVIIDKVHPPTRRHCQTKRANTENLQASYYLLMQYNAVTPYE